MNTIDVLLLLALAFIFSALIVERMLLFNLGIILFAIGDLLNIVSLVIFFKPKILKIGKARK